jgi:citrate lyase beta subunit
MSARRALLYVPGDDLHKIQKAATLGVDCVCLDLEDAVAPDRKKAARATVAEALRRVDFASAEVLVRVNSFNETHLASEDLQAVLPARPHGIVLPKVETNEPLLQAGEIIAQVERRFSWPSGSIVVLAMIETARGILSLERIASGSPRLQALVFGGEDFLTDVGARRTPERLEVFHARSQVVLHAAANDLQAIDMIYVDFHDIEGLQREAVQAAQMGFSGKQVIHPAQVQPVQAAFTPAPDEIAWAERVITAFNEHQRAGRGVFAMDGRLVELPHLKAAQRILERAHPTP